jgi:glycine dehydrogenase
MFNLAPVSTEVYGQYPLENLENFTSPLEIPKDTFVNRHLGVNDQEKEEMLEYLGLSSLDQLIDQTIPPDIRLRKPLNLPLAKTEYEALKQLKGIASQNQVFRSYIGMGYHDCVTPTVIQRNILENPGWYTAYTPYQAEIAQGRLEALLNFQTMIIELTGLEIANASLLDEATAAAEAMTMSYGICKHKATGFFVSQKCHPQIIEVLKTRANPLNIQLIIGNHQDFNFDIPIFGALLPYPATDGNIYDYGEFITQAHQHKALITVCADLLSLALLKSPGELGADIAIGNTQRFGVPLGYGGPHAAYFATKEEYKRQIPGRIVGISKDSQGNKALRLALQTREQHIRREKATSNICTAQVLLAVIASMYAVYHGEQGIKNIAQRVHFLTAILAKGLTQLNYEILNENFFDTLTIKLPQNNSQSILKIAENHQINLRYFDHNVIGISLDETTTEEDIKELWTIFALEKELNFDIENIKEQVDWNLPISLKRNSKYLTDPVFNRYHSETELLRYLHHLEQKDLSLTTSMIPLGSCTMKLNATSEMIPITWSEFSKIHPYAPLSQTQGYQILFQQLESWLAEITGFAGVSLQPNAGSQGEYAGLQVIRKYHLAQNQNQRNICLIPESAHGTNPASAVMCGMKVISIKCDGEGDINITDLQQKAEKYRDTLSALMITYPSTHGVFEENIKEICDIIHHNGGQVYLDGANMNAQVGLCRPGDYGADVCHLNLHKTFCIPHGGGGPGVGPIGVASHLISFLPQTDLTFNQLSESIGMISAAPWGSASILPISWMYIAMMGGEGLTEATKLAILNANYMAKRLDSSYPILYKGKFGFVAHECIIDLRPLKKSVGVEVDDIAKRLMDYGFHAPTMSWPVIGTMMIEPTESESKEELDRFCEAMIGIREEISKIEKGEFNLEDNPLKNAPHTAQSLISDDWNHGYSREIGAYPAPWTKQAKYWTPVGRIDNAFGDRNLICSCVGMDAYDED